MRLHLSKIDRFPLDFIVVSVYQELADLRSQIVTSTIEIIFLLTVCCRQRADKGGTMGDKKALVPVEVIVRKILFLRGEKVLLDRDLAELYGVETRVLKQAVRRNIKRFPEDFMFELTEDENRALRSQNVTLKRGQHSKYLPFAFTEQGVAMFTP